MKAAVAFVLIFGFATASATTAVTPAAGYFRLFAPAGSDTRLALPLLTRSESLGRVVNVTVDSIQLNVSGVADGQFSPTPTASYYLQIKSGNLAGLMFRILASTGSQFRLDTRGADLLDHPLGGIELGATGAIACIRKLATIKEVFGDGGSVALLPVTSLTIGAYQEGDAILVPSNAGQMKLGQSRVSYVADAGWRRSGDVVNDAGNIPLFPGLAFVIRTGPTRGSESFVTGYAPYGRFAVEIPATAPGAVADIHVGLIIADEVSLQASGLLTASTASSPVRASVDQSIPTDVLLGWTDVRAGMDRPPDRRYHAIAGTWYEDGNVANADTLQPGSGYVLRLLEGRDKRFWFQNSTY